MKVPFELDISSEPLNVGIYFDGETGEIAFKNNGRIIEQMFQHDSFKGRVNGIVTSITSKDLMVKFLNME